MAGNASWVVIAAAVFTFFLPSAFNWVRGNTQTVILGIIMLTMGLTLTTEDFKILARRPFDILIGACAQFFIMPCVAYLLVHVFQLEPALALGILLVGCCPGGVSSNIMSYLCHGDVAFSVGMTCASTLLAPVMTPLLMQFTAGEIIEIDGKEYTFVEKDGTYGGDGLPEEAAENTIDYSHAVIESDVDTTAAGNYVVKYSVSDPQYNTGTGTVRLYVVVTEGGVN